MVTSVVIIGGGIAGTTCAEYLLMHSNSDDVNVTIITIKDVVKTAVTEKRIAETIAEIGINEKSKQVYEKENQNTRICVGNVTHVNADENYVALECGKTLKYDYLCICTGAKPVSALSMDNPLLITIRDTDTVIDLKKRLSCAKKVIIIGNGGIALELVYEIEDCEVYWCIKDDCIGNTFFDEGAAAFMIQSLNESSEKERKFDQTIFKRKRFCAEKAVLSDNNTSSHGVALGPDWSSNQELKGCSETLQGRHVTVKYSCTVDEIWCGHKKSLSSQNVYIRLSTGEVIEADFVVSATGVVPNLPFTFSSEAPLDFSEDGGIRVNNKMQSSLPNVFAAGDVCSPSWEFSETWFPMKLWTQAWQLGCYAGKCISNKIQNKEHHMDICFELFSHITTFFGYKVCLLGCFNGQNLKKSDYEAWIRYTSGKEYVKVIAVNGRIKGCLLIGETDLEETFENLILNELDVSFLGSSILDPGVDIEDYFD